MPHVPAWSCAQARAPAVQRCGLLTFHALMVQWAQQNVIVCARARPTGRDGKPVHGGAPDDG